MITSSRSISCSVSGSVSGKENDFFFTAITPCLCIRQTNALIIYT